MRHRFASLLAAASLVGGTAVIVPATNAPVAYAKTCGSGYVHARIGPRNHKHQKCLRRGEFCAHRFNRQYQHYGYNCTRYYRDVHRYRLT